jgi:F-type H+-transporting ATPase subunit c
MTPILAAAVEVAGNPAVVEAAHGIGGNVGMGLVGLGAAIGVGLVGSRASEAIGRNPGAFGKIFTLALLGMAFAEGLAILAFFVAKIQ